MRIGTISKIRFIVRKSEVPIYKLTEDEILDFIENTQSDKTKKKKKSKTLQGKPNDIQTDLQFINGLSRFTSSSFHDRTTGTPDSKTHDLSYMLSFAYD